MLAHWAWRVSERLVNLISPHHRRIAEALQCREEEVTELKKQVSEMSRRIRLLEFETYNVNLHRRGDH